RKRGGVRGHRAGGLRRTALNREHVVALARHVTVPRVAVALHGTPDPGLLWVPGRLRARARLPLRARVFVLARLASSRVRVSTAVVGAVAESFSREDVSRRRLLVAVPGEHGIHVLV